MSEYIESLSPREKEVYCKIVNNIEGKTEKELADEMFISKHTFHAHLISIFQKTGTNSRVELIVKHYHNQRGNYGNIINKRT